ncbi:MAG: tripartite tricarboxylate transporter permease [Negativicutes bacterium]
MDVVSNLMQGFELALSFNNLTACFFGALIGTIVGVLPGIGPVGAMSLLLPFSFGLDAGTSLILWPAYSMGPCMAVDDIDPD